MEPARTFGDPETDPGVRNRVLVGLTLLLPGHQETGCEPIVPSKGIEQGGNWRRFDADRRSLMSALDENLFPQSEQGKWV